MFEFDSVSTFILNTDESLPSKAQLWLIILSLNLFAPMNWHSPWFDAHPIYGDHWIELGEKAWLDKVLDFEAITLMVRMICWVWFFL